VSEGRDTAGRSWRRHGPVLGAYVALTTAVLWPAVAHFRTRPMIGSGDSSIFYWAWWWMPRAVGEGQYPLRTTDIMYPVGVDLGVTVTAPAVGLLSWPVRAWLGPEAQVNAVQLGAAFTAAVAAYFLVHRIWQHRSAAALAGAAFAFTPYRFVHASEHLNLIATGILPVSILVFLRFVERASWQRGAALGGVLGLAVLLEPQLAVVCAVGIAPFVVVHRKALLKGLRELSLAIGVALVVAAPVLVPLINGLGHGESSRPQAARDLAATSASPFSWIIPPDRHPWFGALARVEVLSTPSEGIVYPGLMLIGLAVAGRNLRQTTERRGWVALAAVGFVLSLGPFLVIGHRYLDLPLPYLLLRALPFMDTMRTPGRFALLGVLAVAVLAAGALAVLVERDQRRRSLVLVVVAAVTAVELLPGPLGSRDGGAPAPYAAIADDSGGGAVLEIPMQWSTGVDVIGDTSNDRNVALFMAWATVHGQPYVGGSVSRYPDTRLERLYDISVYRQILAMEEEPGFDDPPAFDAVDLADLGIGYVVYHRDVSEPAVLRHLEGLGLPVLADDGTVIVWKVSRS